MESWRKVLREGFAPIMSSKALVALRKAIVEDDPRLLQGTTTAPPPMSCVANWRCEGGCAVALAGWLGEGLETVGEVREYFARACLEADKRLGKATVCRYFINWFDDTPRSEMRRMLLEELDYIIDQRETAERSAVTIVG